MHNTAHPLEKIFGMSPPKAELVKCLDCGHFVSNLQSHCSRCGSVVTHLKDSNDGREESSEFNDIFDMAEEISQNTQKATSTPGPNGKSFQKTASSGFGGRFQMADDTRSPDLTEHPSRNEFNESGRDTMASIEIETETPLPNNTSEKAASRSDVIRLVCKNCGRKLRVKKTRAGQRIKCPKCEQKIHIPSDRDRASDNQKSSPQSLLADDEISFKLLAKQLKTEEKKAKVSEETEKGKKSKTKKGLSNRHYRKLMKPLEEKEVLPTDKIRLRTESLRELSSSGDPRAYDWLVADLEHNELPIRQAAIVGLGDFGDGRAVSLLVAVLDDDSMVLQKAALLSLGKLKDARAVKPLLLFGLSKPQMKFLASEAVVNLGEQAVQPLIELLDESDLGLVLEAIVLLGRLKNQRARRALTAVIDSRQPLLQCHAIEALGQLADPKSIGPLARLLESPDTNIRMTAAAALTRMASDKNIVAPLIKALKDPDDDVVVQAAKGLGESGVKRAAEPLSQLLRSPQEKIRVAAAQALGGLGDQRAVPHLLKLFEEESEDTQIKVLTTLRTLKPPHIGGSLLKHLNHPSPAVRRRVVDALGPIGDAEAAEQLERVLKRDATDEVRMAAARALGEIADPASVDGLKEALHKDEFNVRCQVIGALGDIGDEECWKTLLGLLKDQVAEVRFHAANALGVLGDKKSTPHLKDLLADKNSLVVRGATKALEKLGESDVENHVRKAQRSKKLEAVHEVFATVKSWFPDTPRGQKMVYGGTLAGVLLIFGLGWLAVKVIQGPPERIFVRGDVGSVSFSGDGDQLVVGRTRGVVEIWSISERSVLETIEVPGSQRVFATPDPKTLAITEGTSIKLWKTDGTPSPEAKAGHSQPIRHWFLSPDKSQVTTLSSDGVAIVWDLKTGEARQGVKLPPANVMTFTASQDGSLFAGGSHVGPVKIWDATTGELKLELPGTIPSKALAFSPESKTLVASFEEGFKLVTWDVETGKVRTKIAEGPQGGFIKLAFDPSGKFLLGFTATTAMVWPVESLGKEDFKPKSLSIKAEAITTFDFPAEGGKLALSSDEDSPVWIYDLATGRLTATLDVAQ